MPGEFSVTNKTKTRLPRLPFAVIKNDILGKNYSLSIAFVDKEKSRTINKKYRGKDKATNILSFPLHKNEGEIILCPSVIRTESKAFNRTFRRFLGFLVIHGMLHLKGLKHSSTMEKTEESYDQKYFGRHRHRIVRHTSRGGRVSKGRAKS